MAGGQELPVGFDESRQVIIVLVLNERAESVFMAKQVIELVMGSAQKAVELKNCHDTFEANVLEDSEAVVCSSLLKQDELAKSQRLLQKLEESRLHHEQITEVLHPAVDFLNLYRVFSQLGLQ